jgi:hypothetical protein
MYLILISKDLYLWRYFYINQSSIIQIFPNPLHLLIPALPPISSLHISLPYAVNIPNPVDDPKPPLSFDSNKEAKLA